VILSFDSADMAVYASAKINRAVLKWKLKDHSHL